MNWLYRRYLLLRSRVAIFVEDMQSRTKIPFVTRIKCLFKGFLSKSYYLYDLKNNNFKDYVSDYERKKTRFINEEDARVLNNKIIFDNMVGNCVDTPTIYSIILNGKIYPYSEELVIDSSEALIEEIKKKGRIVLKPYAGTDGGRGIYICTFTNNNIYFNDTNMNKEEIHSLINKLNKYIITEYVEQHEYSSKIFPHSVNTIRIITMRDPYTQEVFIPIAVHRFGTSRTKNVDNWDRGGLSSEVNIDTGMLSKATFKPIDNKMIWYSNHPDTNAKIEGIAIPKWDSIKEKILLSANRVPFLKYVGWDVVVDKDQNIVIIEANNCSGVNVLQVHKPLLKNPQVKRYYNYHKIL
ncbi:sugar-transfer associated ATP-grasp domain-containing protein [Anaerosalibacter massiliensis]|uniref:sugar-transfer associated ATP-grasp domain-containing protein n=1 Tax=Anaerosalibacter massiliensis TaxID=1347392 RepID=UPI0005B2C428|nr:sugar-transfer associated ATP-grasp domain-containing protein [Anaerosalibacter massiliensis]